MDIDKIQVDESEWNLNAKAVDWLSKSVQKNSEEIIIICEGLALWSGRGRFPEEEHYKR